MAKLNLSEWASIAEIITSVVVVASLVYVGFELQQNTTAIQQSTYQSVLDRLSQQDLLVAADEDLHGIVKRAENDPSSVSEDEWSRFEHFAFPRMGEWEYMFLASEADAISDIQFTAFDPYFTQLFCRPGYQKFWEKNRFAYAKTFQNYIGEVKQSACGA